MDTPGGKKPNLLCTHTLNATAMSDISNEMKIMPLTRPIVISNESYNTLLNFRRERKKKPAEES